MRDIKTLINTAKAFTVKSSDPADQKLFDFFLHGDAKSMGKIGAVAAYELSEMWNKGVDALTRVMHLMALMRMIDKRKDTIGEYTCPVKLGKLWDEFSTKVQALFEDTFTKEELKELHLALLQDDLRIEREVQTLKEAARPVDTHLKGWVEVDDQKLQSRLDLLVTKLHMHTDADVAEQRNAVSELLVKYRDVTGKEYGRLYRTEPGFEDVTDEEALGVLEAWRDGVKVGVVQ